MSKQRKTLRHTKGSWEKMQKLNRIFESEGKKRGRQNEGIVDEILENLKQANAILNFTQDRNLDRIGIDHLVYLLDGEIISIQEKSSPKGVKKHYERYGKYIKFKNQYIRCLVLLVNSRHLVDRSDLKRDIERFIKREQF